MPNNKKYFASFSVAPYNVYTDGLSYNSCCQAHSQLYDRVFYNKNCIGVRRRISFMPPPKMGHYTRTDFKQHIYAGS